MSCQNNCEGCGCATSAPAAGINRFEFEQQIMQCWAILDDIKAAKEDFDRGVMDSRLLDAIGTLYSHRFEKMWATFEALVREKKLL